MRYRFIAEHRAHWSVEEMCRVLAVSRSGFYAWQHRPVSRRAQVTRRLDFLIQLLFQTHHGRYGSVKITQALRQRGETPSRKRVARRMQVLGLRAKTCRKFRVTTHSTHSYPVAPNRLQRCFSTGGPDQVWVSDITYVWTSRGWVYLTVFLDLYARLVVGWAVSRSLSHQMVVQALERAVQRRRPPQGLLIHSDRGVQYACQAFTQRLHHYGFVQSMSRKGNCWDNAVAESFFRTLKTELLYHQRLHDLAHAEHELFQYIELFYNPVRIHASLNYLSPMEFESKQRHKCA